MKLYIVIVLAFLVFVGQQVHATEDVVKFDSTKQEETYRELLLELRCPKCQNQNIADSNAVVAKDMRQKTLELVKQGQKKEEVIDYMVNRYGQFAHYKPPVNIATSMLWLLPAVFIVFAIVMLRRRSLKSNAQNQTSVASETLDADLEQLLDSNSPENKEQNGDKGA